MARPDFTSLKAYAEASLKAHRHPDADHQFRIFVCPSCEAQGPFEITLDHHSGSREGDFRGEIQADCARCDSRGRIFSFSGPTRTFIRSETPSCDCGAGQFFVAECERHEGSRACLASPMRVWSSRCAPFAAINGHWCMSIR